MNRPRTPFLLVPLAVLLPVHAGADNSNWDVGGKIYNKFLYTNDDSQGCLVYGNPFWTETITGGNGVCTEFEVNIKGQVSRWVEAGVRVKSRFHTNWHDWWESGNQTFLEDGQPVHNTSGDSQGMDHAAYMKLRGAFIRIAPPIPGVRWVHAGSTDFSMFNAWTIGKARYIDRDNGNGIFAEGGLGDSFEYIVGAIALPKLFAGPGWSTGLGDPNVDYPFLTQDWAYAAKLRYQLTDNLALTLVGDFTNDLEIDQADPDASGTYYPECADGLGNPIAGCAKDGAVDMDARYQSINGTAELVWDATDLLQLKGTLGYSRQLIYPLHMGNGALNNGGVSPVVFDDTQDFAGLLDFNWDDPFEIGLSFKGQGFYIGPRWNSIFGARREADVLLTDGFVEGGQLPTLNIANEFQDWDEPWYETAIGWQGATLVAVLDAGALSLELEGTIIDYATNGQAWATKTSNVYGQTLDPVRYPYGPIYPDFLHTEGYTDTDLYDYANVGDRGRDLRSVYTENKERFTQIAVLKASYVLAPGFDLKTKFKMILDADDRDEPSGTDVLPEEVVRNGMQDEWYAADDYRGTILQGRGQLEYQLTDWLLLFGGYQLDKWYEKHRSGVRAVAVDEDTKKPVITGVGDYTTTKHRPFVGFSFIYGGATLKYQLEHVNKDQQREFDPDQTWKVWRSKAALEVAW